MNQTNCAVELDSLVEGTPKTPGFFKNIQLFLSYHFSVENSSFFKKNDWGFEKKEYFLMFNL